MATTARKVSYFYFTAPDKPGEGTRLLGKLRDAGVNLLAVHAFPTGGGKSQIDVVPLDEPLFPDAAKKAGLKISERKTAFLIEGDDRPGAVADLLQKLGAAGVNVTALDAVKAGPRYGSILWVKESDVDKAARALGAT
jgi:hypothetical protein